MWCSILRLNTDWGKKQNKEVWRSNDCSSLADSDRRGRLGHLKCDHEMRSFLHKNSNQVLHTVPLNWNKNVFRLKQGHLLEIKKQTNKKPPQKTDTLLTFEANVKLPSDKREVVPSCDILAPGAVARSHLPELDFLDDFLEPPDLLLKATAAGARLSVHQPSACKHCNTVALLPWRSHFLPFFLPFSIYLNILNVKQIFIFVLRDGAGLRSNLGAF